MKRFLIAVAIFIAAVFGSACTDVTRSQLGAYGDPAHVKCHSGGTVIYEGWSTGKVSSESSSDGWAFRDSETKRLVNTGGDCIVTYGK